ncbi:transglutaminase domain-containing protein [Microbacterium sp. SORGH_AS_0888]|uniref:transglutaminase domain-containing protein n=1 Tax=Microbacterium sp. SORGH_AS_0888 TaxID=3041791 RepID=UPI002780C240|nr:transglutaminase domain-containing protein [Microbacterium sp. SORGH_AS_0888]MDQ1130283.1 hypothetical protein [Microbacterium sp. SORGH_AS_0888]
MFSVVLPWVGLSLALVLVVVGVILLIVFVRRMRRARAAAASPAESPKTAFEPSPAYARYDPSNPHYQDGLQYADGRWWPVQVYDAESGQWFVHGKTADGAPTATPVGVPARAARRGPSFRGALVGVVVAALLVVAAVPLGLWSGAPIVASAAASGGLPTRIVAESAQYRYTEPTTITARQALRYDYRIDPAPYSEQAYVDYVADTALVAAYYDADLSQLANYSLRNGIGDYSITLVPKDLPVKDLAGNEVSGVADDLGEIMAGGSWVVSELYLVQYADRDGTPYDKPIVTLATVQPDAGMPETPRVAYQVDADGYLQMTWAPVAGAVEYFPVMTTITERGASFATAVGRTAADATSWSSREGDAGGVDCYIPVTYANVHQNCALAGGFGEQSSGRFAGYGVLARSADGKVSFLERTDARTIDPLVPVAVRTAVFDLPTPFTGNPEDVPTTNGVTTLAGVEAVLPISFDSARVEGTTGIIRAKVLGTASTAEYRFGNVDGRWDAFAEAARQRMEAALPASGAVTTSLMKTVEHIDPDAPIATTKPDVPYPLPDEFGAAGQYIAANLVAGNTRIDLSEQSSPYSMFDLVNAVIAQTPFGLVQSFDFGREGVREILEVTYQYAPDEAASIRQQMLDKAKDVVGQTIHDGMSDRDKALALNDWITANAEYDDAAYNAYMIGAGNADTPEYTSAWSPSGILLKGTAVCEGYAEAYKLLSDVAGLDTVYVTGIVGANGHAWNKTFMDGKWQVVDTTWNDSETGPNQLFGITDEVASEQFEHGMLRSGWMIPTLVGDYAAN